jgi:hypothetical protein
MRKVSPLRLDEFETQPLRISGSARLDADPLAVFAELGDPSLWFPLMRRSVWKTAATGGVGAERAIDNRVFGRARERMLAWDVGERVSFTMVEMDSPFVERFGEEWLLRRDGIYTDVTWVVVATPTRMGRLVLPILRQMLRTFFTRGCTNIQKRAGSFRGESRGKQVS